MRPTNKRPGAVWRLLNEWSKAHEFGPFTQLKMAEMFGVQKSLITHWKFGESVMQAEEMRLIHQKTGIDIGLIAAAVATDKRRRVSGDGTAAANTEALDAQVEKVKTGVEGRPTSKTSKSKVRKRPTA